MHVVASCIFCSLVLVEFLVLLGLELKLIAIYMERERSDMR
jgi:hypothetical protein